MPQQTLPDTQTAYDNLMGGLHNRVFFETLAVHGHKPGTVKQAQAMLDLAGRLEVVAQAEEQTKEASDPYSEALSGLDEVLAASGLDYGVKSARATEVDLALTEAAQSFAQDPVLYDSVLALKAAQAEEIQEQLSKNGV